MYISFLNPKTLKFHFFTGLFPSHFLSISETKFQGLGLPNRGFRMERIAKIDFSRKSFFIQFGVDLCRFLEAWEAVFLVF